MSNKSNKYGYVGPEVTQAFKANKGIFDIAGINNLVSENKWTNFGQLELIHTENVSAGTSLYEFTEAIGNFDTSYNVHLLTMNNWVASADNTIPTIYAYEAGVLRTGGYQIAMQGGRPNGFSEYKNSWSPNGIAHVGSGQDNASTSSSNGYVFFHNLTDSTKFSFATFHWSYIYYTDVYEMNYGSGSIGGASYVNGIRLFPNGGTFAADLSLYGIRYS